MTSSLILHYTKKLILLFLVISFIIGQRFDLYDKLFYFDISLIAYIVLYFSFKKTIIISKFTFNTIKILFIIFLPALVLIPLSNDVLGSLHFFSQYLFLIIILPLFMESVFRSNHFDFLLKILLFGLIVNSLLFLLSFFGFIGPLYFPEVWGSRFSLGEFTPNEMGHYLVLMLFLTSTLLQKKWKVIIEIISILPYIMTMSKTVWIQILLFLLFKRTKLIISTFLVLTVSIYFSGYLYEIYNNFLLITKDFSPDTDSNKIRIKMAMDALNNLPNAVLFPAYHSTSNILADNINAISAHNVFFSYVTNFGLISFLILIFVMGYLIFKNFADSYFRFILFFIFLDSITLLFNPIINSRIVWFPFFIYIYTYHYQKSKYV